MKKNKDNKKEELKKDKSNKEISSRSEKLSGEVDNSFDEIKKLADDFSMSDEILDNEEFPNANEESDEVDNSENFLDRLGDLSGETTSSKEPEGKDKDLEQRLDAISLSGNLKSESDENKETEPLTTSPQSIDDLDNSLEGVEFSQEEIEPSSEDIFSEEKSNEEFFDRLSSSLENDPDYKNLNNKKSRSLDEFKTFEQGVDDSELIEELEQEIENADQAVNPFLSNDDDVKDDEFITNLESIPIDEYESPQEKPLQHLPTTEGETNLPSESWEDLIESTETKSVDGDVFDFENEDSFEDFLQKMDDLEPDEANNLPFSLPKPDQNYPSSDESYQNDGELNEEDNLVLSDGLEDEESVDSLRKSFIDEFDQSAWDAELAKHNEKKWFPRTIESVTNWFRSLNLGEKILIILSFLISLAVLVSIFLVVTQWDANNKKIANPPPAIEATDADLIYPTGLELPGGWFFFLQKGEIKDNRWEPVNAEWLANTKLRKVVAIPWSNQSEAVIQSLTNQHEINLFMNNNDVITYQVEEVLQISRDNVRILSDTEPSLVVILFREDDQDRWTIIAKPKQ